MLGAHIDMTKINMLQHLTNIVKFIIKSVCFFHISSRGGGWVVWARRKALRLEKKCELLTRSLTGPIHAAGVIRSRGG